MAKKFIKKEITPEVVSTFLEGHDPQERIVNFDYKYKDNFITVIYRDENDVKRFSKEPFMPFLWATNRACMRMCNQDRNELIKLMTKYGVWIKPLDTTHRFSCIKHPSISIFYFIYNLTFSISCV